MRLSKGEGGCDGRPAMTFEEAHPVEALIAHGRTGAYEELPAAAQAAVEQYFGAEWGRSVEGLHW